LQRKLPFETVYDEATTVEDGWDAINSMRSV
jgi:methylthioribose-1-phosphate isomerase